MRINMKKKRMKMNRFSFYLKRMYRLTLNLKGQEELVWKELKKIQANWQHEVFEKKRYIETIFVMGKDQAAAFYYAIYEGSIHYRVKILEDYPIELTTDLFILAAHFNNVLNDGVVVVNVHCLYVEYHQKSELLIPLLYNDEIDRQLRRHFDNSEDIYAGFQRLIIEKEAPAIIIADLLKENE